MKFSTAMHPRRVATVSASALLLCLSACNSVQDTLLEQEQPGVILPSDVQNPTGAVGLYTGALGRFRTALNGGEGLWNFSALMTDEMKNADTFSQRIDADQRRTQTFDATLTPFYNAVQTTRGRTRDAINALQQYAPTETSKIAEMYMEMGFMELTLAQNFCNGIPLGETVNGIPQYTSPLTDAQVFTTAIARADSGLTILGASTAAQDVLVRNSLLLTKARAQVDLAQFAAAAATVAAVPTSFQYRITYSQTTTSNGWWSFVTSAKRYSVGDSFDVAGIIKNAIPFASLNDPRVKAVKTTSKGFDNITPFVDFTNYAREDPIDLVNGTDARLIEAEAQLQAANYTAMTATLNALRTSTPNIGNYKPAALAPLVAPTTAASARDLFFREKALWQFGRGERISDLRRLIRQYGLTQDNVFPTGPFHKGGNYESNVTFPVPDAELANPNFKGCLDTKA